MAQDAFYSNKERVQFGTVASPIDLTTTSTITGSGYVPGVKSYVNRVGLVITTSYTKPASGNLTVTLQLASPVNAAPATYMTLSFGDDTHAVGDVIWVDVVQAVAEAAGDDALGGAAYPPSSKINVAPTGPMQVDPGEALEAVVANAAVAGSGVFIFEMIQEDESQGASSGNVYINP